MPTAAKNSETNRANSRRNRFWRWLLRIPRQTGGFKNPPIAAVKIDPVHAGYIEGAVSVIVNVALFALKFYAGVMTNSLALIADAWHTLSDALSSIVVVIATKLAARAPDNEHPFGHGRWEQIASIFIGCLLAIVAYEFFAGAIAKLSQRSGAHFGMLAFAAMIISVIAKELLANYAFYLSDETGNLSLKADGWHHRSDALSSLVVLAGFLIAGSAWWLDGALSIAVAVMIFYAAYQVLRETISQILGETPNETLIAQITENVREIYPQNFFVHHFHLHNYGRTKEVTFHLKIDRQMTVGDSHALVSKIEQLILERLKIVPTIHVEPLNPQNAAGK